MRPTLSISSRILTPPRALPMRRAISASPIASRPRMNVHKTNSRSALSTSSHKDCSARSPSAWILKLWYDATGGWPIDAANWRGHASSELGLGARVVPGIRLPTCTSLRVPNNR